MVLVVVADVPREYIQRSVVRIRFEALNKHKVLRDEVPGQGMKAHAENGGEHEIEKSPGAAGQEDQIVGEEDEDGINVVETAMTLRSHMLWTSTIHERHKEYPTSFQQRGRTEIALKRCRNVDIHRIVALKLVVLYMISFKHSG